MQYEGTNNEYFAVLNINSANQDYVKSSRQSELSLLWFAEDGNELVVDAVTHHPKKNEIVCLTEFHQVKIVKISTARLLKFNRPFYCVLDHDSEVGCKGILYYGADQLPIVKPTTDDLEVLETVWKMLCIEMASRDHLQLEMLQMMLKRLLILCTRIFKNQLNFNELDRGNTDMSLQKNLNSKISARLSLFSLVHQIILLIILLDICGFEATPSGGEKWKKCPVVCLYFIRIFTKYRTILMIAT